MGPLRAVIVSATRQHIDDAHDHYRARRQYQNVAESDRYHRETRDGHAQYKGLLGAEPLARFVDEQRSRHRSYVTRQTLVVDGGTQLRRPWSDT
jgi:hypothetical protein